MKRGKILVIRGGAIGDFILTLPVLAALRSQFPAAGLEVLAYPHVAQLAQAGGLADGFRSIEARALAGFFARDGELDQELADYFGGFGLIVSFLYDPDQIFQENVTRISPAQFIAGPHRPDESAGVHATEAFLKPLERVAIFGADPVPRLNISTTRPRTTPTRRLAVHPGSGSERKNWPESHWAALLQQLLAQSPVQLVLLGGEAEGTRLQRLSAALPPERVQVVFQKPLLEVSRHLSGSDVFLGHDSGITHLAAAVGLPGLVLWGETKQAVWRPQSNRFHIVEHPRGLSHLPAGEVWARLQPLLADSPFI